MTYLSIIYFVLVAVVISLIFSYGFRARGPWGSFWSFFLVLFFGIWAIDAWLRPVGPVFNDVYWIPPLVIGIILALVLVATTPGPRRKTRIEQTDKEPEPETAAAMAIGGVFWIFLLIMLGVAIAGMFM